MTNDTGILGKLERMDRQFIISLIYLTLFIPMLWYIMVRWGDRIEILTLIIGFVTGRVSAVDGVYLGSSMQKKQDPPGTTTVVDATTTTVTKTPVPEKEVMSP